MSMMNKTTLNKNQQGFVAFFVTIMVMIIFGVLILSFSQISNREGISALNRNLSTNALYAAESGINDAYTAIRNGSLVQQTSSCSPNTYGTSTLNNNTKYTCVLVSNTPSTLQYQCPGFCPNNTMISYLQGTNSSDPINQLTINWSDATKNNSGCSIVTPSPFLPANSWPTNCLEVLRVDLVPFVSGTTTLSSLSSGVDAVKTFFLYPQSSAAATQNFSTITDGSVYSANCPTSSPGCSFNITGLVLSSPSYYIRIQYYYGSPQIKFGGLTASGQPISFSGSQVQIDATGLSGTVLKRVSASIALNGQNASPYSLPLPPSYALQSTDSICKSFLTYQSSLYEIIPSTKPGDLTASPTTASEIDANGIDPNSNTDFCNPL